MPSNPSHTAEHERQDARSAVYYSADLRIDVEPSQLVFVTSCSPQLGQNPCKSWLGWRNATMARIQLVVVVNASS